MSKLEVAKFFQTHFTKKIPHKMINYFIKQTEITKRATRSSKIRPNLWNDPR